MLLIVTAAVVCLICHLLELYTRTWMFYCRSALLFVFLSLLIVDVYYIQQCCSVLCTLDALLADASYTVTTDHAIPRKVRATTQTVILKLHCLDMFSKLLIVLPSFCEIAPVELVGIKDVLEQVSSLFADHPDLLREFTYFLPDPVQEQARERLNRAARWQESLITIISVVVYFLHFFPWLFCTSWIWRIACVADVATEQRVWSYLCWWLIG